MTLQWIFAAIHLLGLGIGLGAVMGRARALGGPLDAAGLRGVFKADGAWGGAAMIWISTGLARVFGGFEKGATYYMQNHLFQAKMVMLILILALEVAPMVAIIRWRIALKRGEQPDTKAAPTYARTSVIQAILVVLMVIAATGMARGIGSPK